jgi:hypothetical protein
MSPQWDMSDVLEKAVVDPPSIWFFVAMYGVIQLAGIGMTIFFWPKGQATMTGAFWLCIFVLPIFLWIGVAGLFYSRAYETQRNDVLWWNQLSKTLSWHWRRWTHAHIVLIDSVALTPENDLAERMLGLEGGAPINPGEVLPLPVVDGSLSQPRLEQVIEQLLTPFVLSLSRLTTAGTSDVVLQTSSERDTVDFLRVWLKLGLPDDPAIAWLPLDAESPMVEQWFGDYQMPDYRLVVICQIHDENEEPAYSESAAALLLTTPQVAARPKLKIKPQACLFRPIVAESDTVDSALATLSRAEQVPSKKIKHLWFSRLDKLIRHAVTAAVVEANLNLAAHDIDRAIGKPGPANGWLLQALAAQMVRHGQGAQLVAAPYRKGVALNVVGQQPAPIMLAANEYIPLASVAWASAMMAFAAFFLILSSLTMTKMTEVFLLAVGVIFLLSVVAQIGTAMLSRRDTTRDFYDELS